MAYNIESTNLYCQKTAGKVMHIIRIDNPDSAELPLLINLMQQQMRDIGSQKSPCAIQSAIVNALKAESRACFFLAKEHDIAVAAIFLNLCSGIESVGDYIWINEIQVAPAYRGKGVAALMLNHLTSWAEENDIRAIYGMTDINNQASQALFKAKQFSITNSKWLSRKL